MSTVRVRSLCVLLVWSWLAAAVLHGAAHLATGTPLSPLPPSLTGVVVSVELFFTLGPLVALALLYTRWLRWGALLLLLTMLVALLWGFGAHFLFPDGDNVMTHATSAAAPAFLLTSILVFIIPWAGVTAALALLLHVHRQPPVCRPARTGDQLRGEEPRAGTTSQV